MRAKREKAPREPQQGVQLPASGLPEREEAYARKYFAKKRARIPAPRLKVKHEPPEPAQIELEKTDGVNPLAFVQAFGTTDETFANGLLNQLMNAACPGSPRTPLDSDALNALVASMHAIEPKDELEAMLVAQMVATHSAAMVQLRLLKGSETIPQVQTNGSLATKLLRTFTAQIEALQRYRGKGQQKVTVEHVHVHSGGQAIVGTVNGSAPGGTHTSEEQPQAKALAHASEPTLPSSFTKDRESMPIAGDG
jgi:hypothetical protein